MKVFILSASRYSIGELHNAILFAHQLRHAGGEVIFFTMPDSQGYAAGAGYQSVPFARTAQANAEMLRREVAARQPDAVILADYYNLFMEEPIVEPSLVTELGIPVATFDSMGFAPGPMVLEKEIFRRARRAQRLYGRGGGVVTELPRLPDNLGIIRTCPINRLEPEAGMLNVTLYSKPLTLSPERRQEVRALFGVREGEKLVMMAKAAWAAQAVKLMAMERTLTLRFSYEKVLQQLLELYLKEVDGPVLILGVGCKDLFREEEGRLRFGNLPFLGFDEYQDLLLSADLFLSDNITSCSLAKAMMGQVPAVAVINSALSRGDGSFEAPFPLADEMLAIMQRWENAIPGSIFPYHVYPFGWIKELERLWPGNPYRDALVTCEMFDLQGTASRIGELLQDEKARAAVQATQRRYGEQLAALPGAVEAVNWMRTNGKFTY